MTQVVSTPATPATPATAAQTVGDALTVLGAKLPASLQPWVTTYGPSILAMTGAEVQTWIQRLVAGDITGAYELTLSKMGDAAVLAEWANLNASWGVANAANADRIDLAKKALTSLMTILLTIVVAAVGL